MARTTSFAQNKIDPTRPFFAAVGSVDAAVAFARHPKAIPSKVEALVNDYVTDLSDTVTGTVDELNQQYVDLAARGRSLVNRIRRQESTQRAKDEAKKTTSQSKTTGTQARKAADTATRSAKTSAKETARTARTSAKRTASSSARSAGTAKSSAKATGTSARKAASATTKAAKDAAAKTGN
jgi:heparin binding hemagglutinin HbhA